VALKLQAMTISTAAMTHRGRIGHRCKW